jgi:hypothetical protein
MAQYEPRLRLRLAAIVCCDPEPVLRENLAMQLMRTNDPLARRLGRRYRPMDPKSMSPGQLLLAHAIAFSLTAVVLAAIGALALFSPDPDVSRGRVVAGSLLSALVGAMWGGVLVGVSRSVEIAFVAGALPWIAAAGWGMLRFRDGSIARRRYAWMIVIAACYVGFASGWLWLWGVFGI